MIKKLWWSLTVLFVSGLLYGLAWLNISTLTFFSCDTGIRFLQVQSLIEHQWRSFAIEYPAHFLDPEWRFVPYYRAYLVIDEQLYLSLSPIFNFLTSLLYAVWGSYGLPVLPVSGTILSALAIVYLARLSDLPRPHLLFIATILATPLFFYSLELWDHTWGVGLAMWGIYGLARGVSRQQGWSLFLGGVALGLSIGQRPELQILAIAAGITLFWLLRFNGSLLAATLTGGLTGMLPVWILQYLWFGHPLAPVTAQKILGYGRLDSYLFPPRDTLPIVEKILLLTTIFAEFPLTFLATAFNIIGILLIILSFKLKGRWLRPFLVIGFITSSLGWLIYIGLAWQAMVVGLLSTFPLIAFSVVYVSLPTTAPREQRVVYQFIFMTTFLFVGLAVLLLPTYGGYQWGARYLLAAYPLLLYLAYQTYLAYDKPVGLTGRFLWRTMAVSLVSLTVLLQLLSVRLLYQLHYEQVPTLQAVEAISVPFTITDDPFLASHMSATDYRNFLYVFDSTDLAEVLDRLARHEISQVGILLYNQPMLDIPAQVGEVRLRLSGVGESTINGVPLLIYEFEPVH